MPCQEEADVKIRVNNLTKRFGALTVLDGINFTIKKGELLAIVGPTGCGKTTFLNCLSKLMPATEGERPTRSMMSEARCSRSALGTPLTSMP